MASISVARILCRLTGGALCLIGLVGMLSPIPFGLFLFIIGLMFLIPSTPSAARTVRWGRKKVPLFNRAMHTATRHAPTPYRRVLRETEIDVLDL